MTTTSTAGQAVARTRAAAVTVAICTRGRPETLRQTLTTVIAQKPWPMQILVVDSAPHDDATERLVRSEFLTVAYHREPVPGLDFARNRALTEASHEIVVFLDDDVLLLPGSIARLLSVFRSVPTAGACTGRVSALPGSTEGRRWWDAGDGAERGDRRVRLPGDAEHGRRPKAPRIAWAVGIGSGSCLAVRRTVALFLGGFDEALDLGPVLPGGGDHDMLWRILDAGHEVVYEPGLRARRAHRTSKSGALVRIAGRRKALIALLTKTARHSPWARRAPVLLYLAWCLFEPAVRLLLRTIGREPLPARALVESWRGGWSGLTAYGKGVRVAESRRRNAGA